MLVAEPKTIVDCWFQDIFTEGKLEVLDEITAPDFIVHTQSGNGGLCGPEPFKTWLRWYRTIFTDAKWIIHDVIRSDSKVVVRYSGWTTYQGGLQGIPSTNQRILETGIIIFQMQDGKIQQIWIEMSDLQVMQQLGAFPVPKKPGK